MVKKFLSFVLLLFRNKTFKVLVLAFFALSGILRIIKRIVPQWYSADFKAYYDIVKATANRVNPYDLSNLSIDWGCLPIVPPSYTLFFFPFTFLDIGVGKAVFLVVNLVAIVLTFFLMFQRLNLFEDHLAGWKRTLSLRLWFSIFIFINTVPFFRCITLGQVSILLTLFLFSVLYSKCFPLQVFCIAATASLKYSMLPFYCLMLVFKKRIKLCIFAFGLFIIFLLSPIMFGQNPFELISNYLNA